MYKSKKDNMIFSSADFLTERLPDDYEKFTEEELEQYVLDHKWEPVENYSFEDIWEMIEVGADAVAAYIKEGDSK